MPPRANKKIPKLKLTQAQELAATRQILQLLSEKSGDLLPSIAEVFRSASKSNTARIELAGNLPGSMEVSVDQENPLRFSTPGEVPRVTLILGFLEPVDPDRTFQQWVETILGVIGALIVDTGEPRVQDSSFQELREKAAKDLSEAKAGAEIRIRELESGAEILRQETDRAIQETRQECSTEVQQIRDRVASELRKVRHRMGQDYQKALDRVTEANRQQKKSLEELTLRNDVLIQELRLQEEQSESDRVELQRIADERSASETLWDELTLLPNPRLFPFLISIELSHARRGKQMLAVVVVEIDAFSSLRLSIGEQTANGLYKQAAEKLQESLREGDIVVPSGPGRFLWSFGGLHSVEDAGLVAEKMLSALSRPLDVDGKQVPVTASIGISLYPTDSMDPEALVSNAESALEKARKIKGHSYRFFAEGMNEKIRANFLFRKDLRDAANKQEMIPYYQPVVRIETGEVESAETLIRWKKPDGRLVYPSEFLSLSEEAGVAIALDEWILRTVAKQRSRFAVEGASALRSAVNLSSSFFWHKAHDRISGILRETGLDPKLLELEVSERTIASDCEKAIVILEKIGELGVALSIDDFGSGGIPLVHLKRYPVQTIKIDSSLIRGIHGASMNAPIVSAIISFARNLRIRTVAKGVEAQNELDFLRVLHCDSYQGNAFSLPLPPEEFTELIMRQQEKKNRPAVMKAAPVVPVPVPPVPVQTPVVVAPKAPPAPPVSERIAPNAPAPTATPYYLYCFHCNHKYDALQAAWCSCLSSDQTLVCPACKRCFCKALLEYRHQVWGSAPESLWDRKRRHDSELGPLPSTPSPEQIQHPLVLVVDDEPHVLKVAGRLIRGLGYFVIFGQNGEEGMALARQYSPQLILSDAIMPRMDGREMCRRLKQDPKTANIKAVIMTAFTGAAKYKTSVLKDYIFDEHLQKPIEYEKLQAVLLKYLPRK